MKQKLCPKLLVKDIYEINFEKLLGMKINTLFLDLDGTLIKENEYVADKKLLSWIKNAKENNFKLYIVSNNKKERVEYLAKQLDVPFISHAIKPFSFKVKNFLKKINDNNKYNKKNYNAAFIGDQIFTDIIVGNKLNMHTILVKDNVKEIEINKYEKRPLKIIMRKLENILLKKYNCNIKNKKQISSS